MDSITITYIEVNLFGIAVLLVIFFSSRRRARSLVSDQGVFSMLLICNMIIMMMDLIGWIANGRPGRLAYFVNFASMWIFYFTAAGAGSLWLLYCDVSMGKSRAQIKKRLPLYAIPLAIIGAGLIINIFTPVFFEISGVNLYKRGPYFAISMVEVFSLLFIGACQAARALIKGGLETREKNAYLSLLLFPLAPVVGNVFQIMFYGISSAWQFAVISMLTAFFNVQNDELKRDALTGLLNRREFMSYLEKRIERQAGGNLCMIMADVDDFKLINDKHGHSAGDEALVAAAHILSQSCGGNDCVARYGGDEFVIVSNCVNEEAAQRIIRRIDSACRAYNAKRKAGYEINLSMGAAFDGYRERMSADELIALADSRMYKEKMRKKKLRELEREKTCI